MYGAFYGVEVVHVWGLLWGGGGACVGPFMGWRWCMCVGPFWGITLFLGVGGGGGVGYKCKGGGG